jgi:hypothetical protein
VLVNLQLKSKISRIWWLMPIIPALKGLRQGALEFEVSLDYIARPCLKKQNMK